MMQKSVNTFFGGVDRDTSQHLVVATKATSLKNFRLVTIDGQGFVMSNLRGNELQFSLTAGFVPLGYSAYNGVSFIFSHNPTTGEGEIGTYPSPLANCNGGFEHVYRPLQNWNGAVDPRVGPITRADFRTDAFGFECSRQLEVQSRISYDNTVELFFADWLNPLRHLNTGFDINTGVCTSNRLYWTGSFPNQVNVFFETCSHPVTTDVRQTQGGALQAGNYFIYFAYENLDNTTTSYLSEVGPVQISSDQLSAAVTLDGNVELTDTGKSIEIDLSGLDTIFPYLRVAVVYWNADTFLTGMLATPIPIPPGQTTMTVVINGIEQLADITIEEIIERKSLIDTPRTIAQLDNRLWGGNWKERDLPYSDMRDLATQLLTRPALPAQLVPLVQNRVFADGNPQLPYGHKDYNNTFDYDGYFRGEPYAFAIVYVFKDGKRSKPYPTKGYDAWFDPLVTQPNTKGILRFPSNMNANYQMVESSPGGPTSKVMGVVFDTTGIPLPQWAIDQVCGFYFVRGDRNPDMLYQGAVGNAYNGDALRAIYDPASLLYADERHSNDTIAELSSRTLFPNTLTIPTQTHVDPVFGSSVFGVGILGTPPKAGRFGLFSTDHFFTRQVTDGIYYLVKQGRVGYTETRMGGSVGSGYNPDYLWDQNNFYPETTLIKGQAQVNNVAERTPQPINGYVSGYYNGDDSNAGFPVFIYFGNNVGDPLQDQSELGNREMWQRNYIALSFKNVDGSAVAGTTAIAIEDDPAINPEGPAVVNVYRVDPEPPAPLGAGTYDLESKYEPSLTTYRNISEFIPISEWGNLPNRVFYRGDCFMTRAYHRHMNERRFHSVTEYENGLYYVYGNMMGMIQEATINSAMRYMVTPTTDSQRYYPEDSLGDPINFAARLAHVDETRLRNNGYNRTLGLQGDLGDDVFAPLQSRKHPTRIRYSNQYENDNSSDAYLKWDFAAKRDYDHRSGQITGIAVVNSRLLSVQEQAINFHYVNERAQLQSNASEGELLLGIGDVLSEKAQVITDQYGSQHQFSLIRTERGYYGIDHNKRKMWRVTAQGFDLISDRLSFRKDMVEINQFLSDHSDILHSYGDAPVCDNGISCYWDRKHGDIGWSFILYDEDTPSFKTLVYNEIQDAYMHERTHNSMFYLSINEDLFSVDPAGMPRLNNTVNARFYLHDSDAVGRCSFYGDQDQSEISWAVNPQMMTPKVFDAMAIASNDEAPFSFAFSTEYQTYTQSPFLSANIWETPRYKENQWKLPVVRATIVTGGDYLVGSRMRGRVGKAKVTWDTSFPVTVDAAITTFRPSVN